MQQSHGIPGLKGTEHIGLTVPDIKQAIDFFVNVIGYEPFYDLGPFQSDGDWMEKHLNIHPRSVIKRIKFLRCGNGSNLELFEYSAPGQSQRQPKNSDIGGHHLAYYVEDMDRALEHLREHNVNILGEPTVRESGPSGGQTWVYFLSPWGLQLELVSFPQGKNYENFYSSILWHPAHPEL